MDIEKARKHAASLQTAAGRPIESHWNYSKSAEIIYELCDALEDRDKDKEDGAEDEQPVTHNIPRTATPGDVDLFGDGYRQGVTNERLAIVGVLLKIPTGRHAVDEGAFLLKITDSIVNHREDKHEAQQATADQREETQATGQQSV